MYGLLDTRVTKRIAIAAVVLACLTYLLLAITPSSYALGLQMLGQPVKGLIAGSPKSIRSDEWMVFTPYVQLAVDSHFNAHDMVSPYHESLKAFFSLPVADWAAVFRPYYAAFALLPPANAFSFFYLFNALAFISGWAWFFTLLGIDRRISTATSLTLFFSQFIQVWWTSNCGVFALAPWAAIAWMTIDRRWLRILVAGYALTTWLMADLYPPFIYALGISMAFAVLASRPDLLTVPRLIDAALASLLAGGISLAYYGGMIQIMEGTVYPGHRLSPGGGVEPAKLLGQFYPFALTKHYEPLSIFHNTNSCEIAIVGSCLPLFCALFLDYSKLFKAAQDHLRTLAVLFIGIVFCSAWIFLPLPAAAGKLFGLTLVPGNRLLLALGWLITITCLVLMSICGAKLNTKRLITGLLVMMAIICCKQLLAGDKWHDAISYFDFTPVLALFLLLLLHWLRPSRSWVPLVVTAIGINALTFGLFNPLQSAYPIFSINQSAVKQHLLSSGATATQSGALIVPGDWGALINGAGIPSFNHVLLYPQLGMFKKYFSQLPANQFNNLFNRYEHVSFAPSGGAELVQADLVKLPIDRIEHPALSSKSTVQAAWARIDSFTWQRTHDNVGGNVGFTGQADEISDKIESPDRSIHLLKANITHGTDGRELFQVKMPSKEPAFMLPNGKLSVFTTTNGSKSVAATGIYGRIVDSKVIQAQQSSATISGVVDTVSISSDTRQLHLIGWAAINGDEPIAFNIAPGAPINALSIHRIDRPDVARLVDPSYEKSGFDIVIDYVEPALDRSICIDVQSPSGYHSNLTFPDKNIACTTIR